VKLKRWTALARSAGPALFLLLACLVGGYSALRSAEHESRLESRVERGQHVQATVKEVTERGRTGQAIGVAIELPDGQERSLDISDSASIGSRVGDRIEVVVDPEDSSNVLPVDAVGRSNVAKWITGVLFFGAMMAGLYLIILFRWPELVIISLIAGRGSRSSS
jgi:hypothetical protein